MPIKTLCPCGASFSAPEKFAGKKVKCPKCDQPVAVKTGSDKIATKCGCGKVLQVPKKLAGKTVKCSKCGNPVKVPGPSGSRTSKDSELDELFDEVNLLVSRTGHRCPKCRRDLDADDVICVDCGFNLETGKQMATKTVKANARNAVAAAVAASEAGLATQKSADQAPPEATSLAKLLNQVGTLGVLAAVGFVAFRCYQAVQANSFDINQISAVMTGSGGYVLVGVIVLFAVPCAVAAKMVGEGKAAGRVMAMAMAGIGIVGLITTVPAIFALKLAMSDEVAQYCR